MPATTNSAERSLLFDSLVRTSPFDPAGRPSSVDPGARAPVSNFVGGLAASGPPGGLCAVPKRCWLCGSEGGCSLSGCVVGRIRDASTLSPLSIPRSSEVYVSQKTAEDLGIDKGDNVEAIEALHGVYVHTQHVHLRLAEVRLRRRHRYTLLGERRDASDALDPGEVVPNLADE